MNTPKAVVFGGGSEKPDIPQLKSTWMWFETDNEVTKILAKERPDVIITLGPSTHFFKNLCRLPLPTRKKWVHYEEAEDIDVGHLMNCMIAQLNNHFATEKETLECPLVSVFTTSFKSKHRIQRPLHSLLKQTWTNWEWIIIDDTDDDEGENWQQLQDITSLDYRIRSFKPHRHSGVIGSLKRDAAMLCSGDLLVELDHDDDIHPETFDHLVAAFREHPDAGMFWTDFAEVMEDTDGNWDYGEFFSYGHGSYCKQRYLGKWRNMAQSSALNSLTIRNIIGVPNHVRVWSKKAYLEMGGHSPYLHVADDYELCVRTFLKYKMVRIPKLCYIQYRNAGGNNFTFIRNAEIQKLMKYTANLYEPRIKERLAELGIQDRKGIPNNRAWLKEHEPEFEKRADILGAVPEDLISIIIGVEPHHTQDAIVDAVDVALSQGDYVNVQIIAIGYKSPFLPDAMEHVYDERVQWWNLKEDVSQSTMVARNYATKMIAVGKFVAYIDPDRLDIYKQEPSFFLEQLKAIKEVKDGEHHLVIQNTLVFKKGETEDDMSHLFHSRDLMNSRGFWRTKKSAMETIDAWIMI